MNSKRTRASTCRKTPLALQRIKEAAEKAKIELSTTMETEINQPFITTDANGPKHLVMKMNRAKLEELVGRSGRKDYRSLQDGLKTRNWIPRISKKYLMVGGMTRMPLVQKKVKEFFGKEPHLGVNPDEVVAIGRGGPGRRSAGRRQRRFASRCHAR